jgi:hypothetical protein
MMHVPAAEPRAALGCQARLRAVLRLAPEAAVPVAARAVPAPAARTRHRRVRRHLRGRCVSGLHGLCAPSAALPEGPPAQPGRVTGQAAHARARAVVDAHVVVPHALDVPPPAGMPRPHRVQHLVRDAQRRREAPGTRRRAHARARLCVLDCHPHHWRTPGRPQTPPTRPAARGAGAAHHRTACRR